MDKALSGSFPTLPVSERRVVDLTSPIREDALSLAVFLGPGTAGCGVLVTLALLGTIVGPAVGAAMVLWAVVSFVVYFLGFCWIEQRQRRKRAALLAVARLTPLARRVIYLYSRTAFYNVEEPRVAEVFALYRQADESLQKDPRASAQSIRRGILLADEIFAGQ